MKPTPEQERAIETEGQALLVEAGAGTGKTWVLVERFLHLLSEHPAWPLEGIVAITFTEKATREMRSRIRTAIEKQAAAESDALYSVLVGEKSSPWSKRQTELEGLRVSTIHGLCSLILRENAIAAGIDPRFTVLDELEAGLLKMEAIRKTLADLAKEDDSSLELLTALHVRDLRQELENLLEKRGTVKEQFDELPESEELLRRWKQGLADMRSEIWRDFLKEDPYLVEAIEQIPTVPIIDPADILSRAVILAQEGRRLLAQEDLIGAASSWIQIRRNGGRSSNWGGMESLKELKLLLKALQDAAKGLDKTGATNEIGAEDEEAARWLHHWRRLWTALISHYDQLKEERHALDFDDLEIHTERLLYSQPRSRRLQDFLSGLHHLMVDEFQDTNRRQGRIVYALAHPEDNGRLFVVGDAKQSIYRFRQAQVAVFNRTAKDIELITSKKPLPLSQSFRTHWGLLETLNDLFDRILQPIGNTYSDYEARPGPLSAHRPAPPPDSTVPIPMELVIIPKKDNSDNNVSAEMGRRWEAAWLAERITSLRDGRFEIWDKKVQAYRHFQFGDAAILYRATTNLPLYEEVFKREGLPYLTLSGRGYYDRPEIRDLVALLNCLYDPGDDLSLAAALRSPMFSFSDETLYRLRCRTPGNKRSSKPIPLAKALENPPPNDQNEAVEFAASVMSDLWERTRRVAVWQLLRTALDRTGYEATLLLSDKKNGGSGRQYNNILKFMALAREQGVTNLSDFLRRLQDIQLREAREGEAPGGEPGGEAVQLMSIHAAKGLEFPVVALADLGRRTGGRIGSPRILHDPAYGLVCKGRDENGDWTSPASFAWASWMDKRMDEAESRRLLYVACTRAADLLILSGKFGERNSWLQKLLSAWEIDAVGEDEEIISEANYAVRVMRLDAGLDERAQLGAEDRSGHRRADDSAMSASGEEPLLEIPALARKVDMSVEREPMSVSRMARILSKEVGGYPEIRPVVILDKDKSEQAPHYRIGRVVHRALADWSCLAYLEPQLLDRLNEFARQAGAADDVASDAARKAQWMIGRVQRSSLYVEIDKAHSAQRFYSEVPFSLETEPVPLHGIVDLIYQDQAGLWHLIDWKTEWVDSDTSDNKAVFEHRHQIAAYAMAIERTLGVRPTVSLCFLNPHFRPIRIRSEAVDLAWQEILEGNP